MDLDKITIAMRPRSHREAMDLGLSLLQNNWRALYRPLLLFIIPLFLILNLIFSSNMWIAALIIWWLKPLYDRLLLFVLSRSLFADVPATGETLAAIPGLMKKGLLWQLTLLRLSPNRSFNMPVWTLEGLSGETRRHRIQVLQSRTSGYATWLLILCWHLEMIMLFSFYILIIMFLPQNFDFETMVPFFSQEPPYWFEFVANFLYLMAILIIEPFYVAAGFMLYINRRSQLEAWDIEIQFRRIAQRLGQFVKKSSVIAASILIAVLLYIPSIQTIAEETPAEGTSKTTLAASESKRVIEEILKEEDFGTERKESYWALKNQDDKEIEDDFSFNFGLGPLFASILKFILIGLLIAFIIYLLLKARHLAAIGEKKKAKDIETPEILFGMKITPESLPDNIIEEATQLWTNKQYREAMSLLYRGSLSCLVNKDNIALNNAMTEHDILACAKNAKLAESRILYLDQLTRAWQSLAYAHRLPDEAEVQHLFNKWPLHYRSEQQS